MTLERQTPTRGALHNFLSVLAVFYFPAGAISFLSAFLAPWFNWGFMVCALLSAAGLLVIYRYQEFHAKSGNVYGKQFPPFTHPRYAFVPLAVIVAMAVYKMISLVGGYFFA